MHFLMSSSQQLILQIKNPKVQKYNMLNVTQLNVTQWWNWDLKSCL